MKSKQFLVLGLGRFGTSLARTDEELVNNIAPYVTQAMQLDATDETLLASLGVKNFDAAIVSIGQNTRDSILVCVLLKELGAPYLVAKANDDLHAKVLRKIGADRVIFPERDMGARLARSIITPNVLELMNLSDDYQIMEIRVPQRWVGDSIIGVNVRRKYGVNILAIHRADRFLVTPAPDIGFEEGDTLLVMGKREDIERLVRPILEKKADIVIGERPIDETEHFSKKKKMFQHLGSWVVRVASNTDIPDAPSGFRAYSREGALRLNVVNDYSYTLETIIQAGWNRIPMTSVPVRTNPELRPSRLFKSMWRYMKRSSSVILRAFAMYKPLRFFGIIGGVFFGLGVLLGVRFLIIFFSTGSGSGHIQSLILCAALLMIGVQVIITGVQADLISDNRKLLEDVQYRVRKMEIDRAGEENKQ